MTRLLSSLLQGARALQVLCQALALRAWSAGDTAAVAGWAIILMFAQALVCFSLRSFRMPSPRVLPRSQVNSTNSHNLGGHQTPPNNGSRLQ